MQRRQRWEGKQTARRPPGLGIHPEDGRFELTTARNSPAFFQSTACCQDLQTHVAWGQRAASLQAGSPGDSIKVIRGPKGLTLLLSQPWKTGGNCTYPWGWVTDYRIRGFSPEQISALETNVLSNTNIFVQGEKWKTKEKNCIFSQQNKLLCRSFIISGHTCFLSSLWFSNHVIRHCLFHKDISL